MSYDYLLWKREPTAKTAMLAEVCKATGEGTDHPAMATFDVEVFERSLKAEFGDVNNDPDGPFLYWINPGERAPWLKLNVNYSQVEAVTDKIVALAVKHGLLVYDLQCGAVWGNRRS